MKFQSIFSQAILPINARWWKHIYCQTNAFRPPWACLKATSQSCSLHCQRCWSFDLFLFSVHLGSRWCRARNPITAKARVQRNMAPVWSLELAAAPPALIWTPTPASQALHRTLSQSTQGRFPANGRERERQTDRLRDVPVCVSDVVFGTNASRTLNFGNGPTAWGCLLLRL